MSFFGIPKIPTGPLRRALGLPSTGKNFVDKIVSMAPSSSQAELKQELETQWPRRILQIGGKDFVQLIEEHPALMGLIQQELQKIPKQYTRENYNVLLDVAQNISMTNPKSPILDLVDGFTYFNKVANLMPEIYGKLIVKNMALFWVNRPHKDRGAGHMIELLKTPCVQSIVKRQRDVLKAAEQKLKEQKASGATEAELEGDKERNCVTLALAFAQGIDTVMDSDFWSDKDGKLIGIKKHRSTDIGKECGVGFFPDGKEGEAFPPVPPPQGAVDNGGIKEGESPLAFAPLPPNSMKVGSRRRRKTHRKLKSQKKTRSRKFHR
jgi:hypothetical protein